MKRIAIYTACLAAAATAVVLLASSGVFAEGDLSEYHQNRIRTNCTSAKSSLDQLHRADALLRVDRGQTYEAISTKLMAPLNSRVILHKMDAVTLVDVATKYNQKLALFRSAYQAYETSLSGALKIDCKKEPQKFYYAVEAAGEKRQAVHQVVQELHNYIWEYGDAVDAFSSNYQKAAERVEL